MNCNRHTLLLAAAAAMLSGMMAAGCAKQGFPNGGPKDETPPAVLGCEPANGTLNFAAKEFLINFDEYVQVKDADNNILVSPPMAHKPEYATKGRGILVKLKDTLHENTTYLFQFKEGIVDFNEGNPLKSFEYVFSTGSSIDSMTIRGKVVDAFTGKPREETVTVMAYAECDSMPDSLAAKERPLYMTRCDKEGAFALNHLREGRYLLMAIEDGDKNLRLSTGEPAAFLDTLVLAQRMPPPSDTAEKGSAAAAAAPAAPDSLAADTLAAAVAAAADSAAAPDSRAAATADSPRSIPAITPVTLRMSLFKKEVQRVGKSEFKRKGYIEITTVCPLTDSFAIAPLGGRGSAAIFYKLNPKRDTLAIWTADPKCDSVVLRLADAGLCDTLKLQFREKKAMAAPPGVVASAPKTMKSLVNANHPYYDTLRIEFVTPMGQLCLAEGDSTGAPCAADSAVRVLALADSSVSWCRLTPLHDCTPWGSCRAAIDFKGKAGEKYQFTLRPGLFEDICGKANTDSLAITAEYTKAESYGNIALTLELDSLAAESIILQLTDEKGDMLQERVVTESQKISFPHLKGGKYGFRAIIDSNGDGQWTAGDWWQHRQPERIVEFEKTLELRENWDMEEKWAIR